MKNQGMNLFIIDDNNLMMTKLKLYLQNRFGVGMNISTFNDGESCLKLVDKNTQIVILDYYLNGKNGLETLRCIKAINPKTEVIMLSSNEEMGLAIETFRAGANDFVIKGEGAWKKISKLVERIVTKPIRIMVREFGVSKFTAILLMTFMTMGVVVVWVLYSMHWI